MRNILCMVIIFSCLFILLYEDKYEKSKDGDSYVYDNRTKIVINTLRMMKE